MRFTEQEEKKKLKAVSSGATALRLHPYHIYREPLVRIKEEESWSELTALCVCVIALRLQLYHT